MQAPELLSLSVKSRQKWRWNPFISSRKDVYFAKPLLTCSHALAHSTHRYARGKRKRGRTCTNKWVGGWQLNERDAFMYDGWEVERGADCQMFPLSLLCVFDTQSVGRSDRGTVGELRSDDWRWKWNKRRGKWGKGGEDALACVTWQNVSSTSAHL